MTRLTLTDSALLTLNADRLRSQKFYNNERWVTSFHNGEEKGFNFFFHQYHAAVCYFSFQIIKDKDEAVEVVNDAFMKLWERHANFETEAAIRSFLYTTVRNTSLNRVRDEKRKSGAIKEYSYINKGQDVDVSEKMIEAEVYKEIFHAINSLPPRCKQIFKMLMFEHKDQQQIAEELNLSVSTIQNQKARAIMLLRQRIAFLLAFFFPFTPFI